MSIKNKLYPIKFTPEPRERVWGGDYLYTKLGKEFDEEKISNKIGESWDIWSLYGASSTIANGFLQGNTLDDALEIYLSDLVGEQIFEYYRGEFPLFIKILDIPDRISLQIHPNDEIAREMDEPFGKAECWYILDAKEDSKIYVGFNKDMTPTELYERCKNGTIEEVLNCYTPKRGDFIYIKPGCVHSACNGVVMLEIQQSSDITFRLFDWGRENNPKTARRMDLEDAIDVIDYNKTIKEEIYKEEIKGSKLLIETPFFIVKSLDLTDSIRVVPSLVNSFITYTCTRGEVNLIMNDKSSYSLKSGESILIPASMEDFILKPISGNPLLLECYMPQPPEEVDEYIEGDDHDDYECKDDNCNCHGHHHHHHHAPHSDSMGS